MIQITVQVAGMACGMCEAHVNDVVRKAFPVKKVTSSHSKGQVTILTERDIGQEQLKSAISGAGYQVTGIKKEPYKKKGLLSVLKK